MKKLRAHFFGYSDSCIADYEVHFDNVSASGFSGFDSQYFISTSAMIRKDSAFLYNEFDFALLSKLGGIRQEVMQNLEEMDMKEY